MAIQWSYCVAVAVAVLQLLSGNRDECHEVCPLLDFFKVLVFDMRLRDCSGFFFPQTAGASSRTG